MRTRKKRSSPGALRAWPPPIEPRSRPVTFAQDAGHSALITGVVSGLAFLGDTAISPDRVLLFSETQMVEHEAWNARKSRYNVVPPPFDPQRALHWSPLWSLTERRTKYLPTSLCYYHDWKDQDEVQAYFRGCSNGCAAGRLG